MENEKQLAVITGTVLNDQPLDDGQMAMSTITWPCDSGTGIFSRTNKLLGIVSTSFCPPDKRDRENFTRTSFAPSTMIQKGWKSFLTKSGQIERPGHRLADE
ncbi:hypothetical protein M3Y94_01154100 [Aphelenchoides besseyi]|nr:hypothetical protein M3Y94_01154100 [Aphelenchoides besseyi]